MAKNALEEKAVVEKTVTAADQLTLTEFCMRLSENDKRVELIGAFNFEESKEKRLKDTFDEYSKRFQAFLNKPA